jgi:hypothetical protein
MWAKNWAGKPTAMEQIFTIHLAGDEIILIAGGQLV